MQSAPSSSSQLTVLETPSSGQNIYGARIRGYICPPQSGQYTFTIAGDDGVELWLSTDDNASNKIKIAGYSGGTAFREWNKYASQNSAPIYLQTGKRYYIEALHKQGWGGDHISVAWQLPNGTFEAPIPGSRLSSYLSSASSSSVSAGAVTSAAVAQQNSELYVGAQLAAYPNPFNSIATVRFSAAEAGPATLDLYDLNGRQVQRLFSGQVEAGMPRSLTIKSTGLPAGVYLLRLATRTKVLNQKITLSR